jgi:hypothetical protein
MALLSDISNIIILQNINKILQQTEGVINHYALFYKLLQKLQVFSPDLVSLNFRGRFILVLIKFFNDIKFLSENKIKKCNTVYYISNSPITNFEIYNPTENDLKLFKFKPDFLKKLRLKKQNFDDKGNTIYHDLILEKSYETIAEMLETNSFDTNVKNYLNILPLDYIDMNDERMCNLFKIPYKKICLRLN